MNSQPPQQRLSLQAALRRQAAAGSIPSPCSGVCRIDERTGWCAGCWRTLDEIAALGSSDDDTRRRIWRAVEARQAHSAGAG